MDSFMEAFMGGLLFVTFLFGVYCLATFLYRRP